MFENKRTDLKKASVNEKARYNFTYIEMGDFQGFENALEDIYQRRIDGLIIKNALSPGAIGELIEFVDSRENDLVDEHLIEEKRGFTYPVSFSKAPADIEERKKYFLKNEIDREFINNNISIENVIVETFKKLSGGRSVEVPKGRDGIGTFSGFTFRKLVPEFGNLPIHCGNVFHQNFAEFYSHLDSLCKVKNQLSYFYTLQSAEGGELILFDIEWKDGQQMDGIKHVFDIDGSSIDSTEGMGLKRMSIPTEEGDLLLFAGGEIWHSVNKVSGSRDRITIGGFLAFSNDDKKILFWS
ncbi:MAG: 2OG-Fe(II) oxygenase [Acidobacteria bacterium]|nr:2OG-Fe(II) oxygenase [Acidobacteriota bacterium]